MESVIRRRPYADDSHLEQIQPPLLRQMYATRGIDRPEQLQRSAQALLHFDKLNGIDQASNILAQAIIDGRKVMVIGDFDADGATSTALTLLALQQMGCTEKGYLVPNRFDFGYGLSPEIVEVAHQHGAQTIVTVDNGIACFAGVERAKSYGMQVIITDHHLAAERLPNADAIVNPNQPGCEFLSKNLAGVGVAFYVMIALRNTLREKGWFAQQGMNEPNLAGMLDIVALGTVADVVPLDDNNRVLVHQGLQRIRSGRCRPGIQALIDVAGKSAHRMSASDLAFVLAPRLNAAGRLDDMALGIECLLADDPAIARRMAIELDRLNQERREIQTSMQNEALENLASLNFDQDSLPSALIVYQPHFHQGVIGIVAGKIKEQFNRPTIAFAHQDDDRLKGSARSIAGLHIRDMLEEVSSRYPDIIEKFGGHAMAAGLTIKSEKLAAFESVFTQVVGEALQGIDLTGQTLSDGPVPAELFNLTFAQTLRDAGPWGQGFPEPLFDDEFDLLEQKLLGNKHLKMLLRHSGGELVDGIAFNVDTQQWPNHSMDRVRLAYKLDINEFRGKIQLQVLVEAMEAV